MITPDSCTVTRMRVDMETLRRSMEMASREFQSMDIRTHALIEEFAAHSRPRHKPIPGFSIYSDSDYFSIKVDNDALDPSHEDLPFEVVARAPKAVRFRYELHQLPEMPQFFEAEQGGENPEFNHPPLPRSREFRTNVSPHRRGIDLDSVIRAPRDRKASPGTNEGKKRYVDPVEL